MELVSLDALMKDVRGNKVPAWFALLRECNDATNMGLDAGSKADAGTPPSRWDKLCDEYGKLFSDPGTPVDRPIKHRIDVEEGTRPPA